VSVILLERLGGTLPIGVPLSEELIEALSAMVGETGHFGVDNRDIRYANILAAAGGPTSLPGLPSPITGRTYPYRIVDLELCEKINAETWLVSRWQIQWIERIARYLPEGDIREPWE